MGKAEAGEEILRTSSDRHQPGEAYPKAKAAAIKALELDHTAAEAHNSLADVKKGYDWDWVAAEAEYKRALELNPSYSLAHMWVLAWEIVASAEAFAARFEVTSCHILGFGGALLPRAGIRPLPASRASIPIQARCSGRA